MSLKHILKKLKSNVDHYLKLLENHKQNRNEIIQKLSIEENNLHHHKQTKMIFKRKLNKHNKH